MLDLVLDSVLNAGFGIEADAGAAIGSDVRSDDSISLDLILTFIVHLVSVLADIRPDINQIQGMILK